MWTSGWLGGRGGDLTFVAISNRVEVDVVLVVADEQQAEPGVEGVDWHDEEDADDVALLIWHRVGAQVCVDLKRMMTRSMCGKNIREAS